MMCNKEICNGYVTLEMEQLHVITHLQQKNKFAATIFLKYSRTKKVKASYTASRFSTIFCTLLPLVTLPFQSHI